MLWQKVERGFKVPLEDGRSFKVGISPYRLLQCTCVCLVSPHICFVHSGPDPKPMIHRVVHDSRALMCEHGILHSSTHPCDDPKCAEDRALLNEHWSEAMCVPDSPPPPAPPISEEPTQEPTVILEATACSSCSATQEPEDCPVCRGSLEGTQSYGRTMFNPHTGVWGKTSCCGSSVHHACLFRWLSMCVKSAERRCMFCRRALTCSSHRAWQQNCL